MSSILTLKNSEVSPPAEQNPRALVRSRLPQERRLYQVNALPNLLLSPQQKPPELETAKNVEVIASPPKLWKRLSVPGTFSIRSSWSSGELLSVSEQDATPLWEEKRQKGFGLGDRIKHLLSHKRSIEVHSDHLLRPPTAKAEPAQSESEAQPHEGRSRSLETQIAEFGSKPFRLTPMNDMAMLAVTASLPDSEESSLSEDRPSTSLFNLTAGLDDSDWRPGTATSALSIDEQISTSQLLADRPIASNLSGKDVVLTVRQAETDQTEGRPTNPYDINACEDAVLDSIVDFFESFGVGFCWTKLEEDTIGMGSPADNEPISKSSAIKQPLATELV